MRETWWIRILRWLLWTCFRLLFRIEFTGRENIPESGPCIIAPNHRTYLDPLFVGLGMKALAHYMAWDRLFRIPLLGSLMTRFGAFPVDVLRADKSSYKRSLEVLERGEFLVVFPEGGRTRSGALEELKPGVARMALATGAPVVPCTILGGERVWPATRRFPRPGKIRVIFHPPLVVAAERVMEGEEERARVSQLLALLRSSILHTQPAAQNQ